MTIFSSTKTAAGLLKNNTKGGTCDFCRKYLQPIPGHHITSYYTIGTYNECAVICEDCVDSFSKFLKEHREQRNPV